MIIHDLKQSNFPRPLPVSEAAQSQYQGAAYSVALPVERSGLFQEKGSSISFISPTYIHFIASMYTLRGDRLHILHFIETYPFLIPLLVEAYSNIQKEFPYSQIFLRIANDPEELDADKADKLVASIATNLDANEATDALARFDKRWRFSARKQARGKLLITLEF